MATVPGVQLSSLTIPWTIAQAKAILLGALQAPPGGYLPFPVTAWQEGGVARTLVEADANALSSLSSTITQIAYAPYMQSYINPPATGAIPDGWCDLAVYSQYLLTRNPAITLVGFLTLTDAGNAGPFNVAQNAYWAISSSGLRYNNVASFTIPKGGTVVVQVTAETSGSVYNVAAGTIGTSVTALAGVTVANYYTGAINGGASTGEVVSSGAPTAPSTPWSSSTFIAQNGYVVPTSPNGFFYKATTGAASTGTTEPAWPTVAGSQITDGAVTWTCQSLAAMAVKITTAGNLGGATFQYSSDGGVSYNGTNLTVPAAIAPATYGSYLLTAFGITLNFQPGSGTSYALNDVFPFSAATWISTIGVNVESSAALATRGTLRWPSLGTGSPAAAYQLWATTASANVTRVNVFADPAIAGQIDIYLAGPNGPVGTADVNAVQTYISARAPVTSSPVVASAAALTVTLTATVNVKAAQITQAQAQAVTNFNNYVQTIPVGGKVYLSALIEQLMLLPGVVSVNLPVSSPAGDTALAANQVATLTLNLTWVTQ